MSPTAAAANDLVVAAMSAQLVGVPASKAAHEWLDRTASTVAHEHLPRAVSATSLPPGHWFLPRLELALKCRGLAALPALADEWSRLIVDSIAASLATDPEWVCFPTDVDLVAAMVASAATGRPGDDWLWTQAGLPAGIVDRAAPAGMVVAALRLHPDVAVAALVRAAADCGVTALDRALGEDGWYAVSVVLGAPNRDEVAPSTDPAPPPPDPKGADGARSPAAAVARNAEALVESSSFGRLVLTSRLRPSRRVATLWAWLVVADVEPALLSPDHQAWEVVDAVRTALEARLPGPSVRESVTGRAASASPAVGEAGDGGLGGAAEMPGVASAPSAAPAAPHASHRRRVGQGHEHIPVDDGPADARASEPAEEPRSEQRGPSRDTDRRDQRARLRSTWSGLVYLLATAEESGLPGCVSKDSELAGRGVRWSVWRSGLALTRARQDDPALLALCGLDPGSAATMLDAPPATPDELTRVARLAERWRRVTLRRLGTAQHGRESVPSGRRQQWDRLVRRPGEVLPTPGWIEVVLPLASVDTAVRSAGLDRDPGFLWWLGTVVVIRYE